MIYSEILLPEYAPEEFADRSILWNAVENFEKGSRAQLSREIEFSLPCELDADERLKAAKELAEFFRDKGMVVDMNLHNPDHENSNPHCHLMLTMRPFQKDGTFLEKKCWREYELDENGQKIPTKKGNDYKSHKVYATDWDDKKNGGHCGRILKLIFTERTDMRLQWNALRRKSIIWKKRKKPLSRRKAKKQQGMKFY